MMLQIPNDGPQARPINFAMAVSCTQDQQLPLSSVTPDALPLLLSKETS